MNREQYFQFHADFTANLMAVTRAKNADYAGPDDASPFENFTRVESLGFASTEQGFLTRMLDKFCRLSSFVQTNQLHVKDESVQDTLADLANYCILFAGYLASKKKNGDPQPDGLEGVVEGVAKQAEEITKRKARKFEELRSAAAREHERRYPGSMVINVHENPREA